MKKASLYLQVIISISNFGYILTWKYFDSTVKDDRIGHQVVSTLRRISPCLNDLWDLDKIGICDSPYVKDDDKALE